MRSDLHMKRSLNARHSGFYTALLLAKKNTLYDLLFPSGYHFSERKNDLHRGKVKLIQFLCNISL